MDFLRSHAKSDAPQVIDAWSSDKEHQGRARIALRELTGAAPQPDFDTRTPTEHQAAGADPIVIVIADLGRW